jgi:hypothetical protein
MNYADFKNMVAAFRTQFGFPMDMDGEANSVQFLRGWVLASKLSPR